MSESSMPPSKLMEYLRKAIPDGEGKWTVIDDVETGRKFAVIGWGDFKALGLAAGIDFKQIDSPQ